MDNSSHTKAMEILRSLLEKRWVTSPLDETSHQFPYLSGSIPFNCYAEINPDMEGLFFRAIYGGATLEKEYFSCIESLCTNHNIFLPVGCFAFNRDSGDFRYKSGIYFWGQELTEKMMRNVIEPSIELIDHYILSFVSASVGKPLHEALARVGEDPGIGASEMCHYKYEPHPRTVG
jgi:hypothetical protein